jgi:hypothetical protein
MEGKKKWVNSLLASFYSSLASGSGDKTVNGRNYLLNLSFLHSQIRLWDLQTQLPLVLKIYILKQEIFWYFRKHWRGTRIGCYVLNGLQTAKSWHQLANKET